MTDVHRKTFIEGGWLMTPREEMLVDIIRKQITVLDNTVRVLESTSDSLDRLSFNLREAVRQCREAAGDKR